MGSCSIPASLSVSSFGQEETDQLAGMLHDAIYGKESEGFRGLAEPNRALHHVMDVYLDFGVLPTPLVRSTVALFIGKPRAGNLKC